MCNDKIYRIEHISVKSNVIMVREQQRTGNYGNKKIYRMKNRRKVSSYGINFFSKNDPDDIA